MSTKLQGCIHCAGRVDHSGSNPLLSELLELVYDELRRIASWQLAALEGPATQTPTDLVHEAVERICRQRDRMWESESHLQAIATMMIRRVLLNHLRSKRTLKRGGHRSRRSLDEESVRCVSDLDLLELDEALKKLEALDQKQSTVVELKFYGGMSSAAIAEYLGISVRSVQLRWDHARLWLARELSDE